MTAIWTPSRELIVPQRKLVRKVTDWCRMAAGAVSTCGGKVNTKNGKVSTNANQTGGCGCVSVVSCPGPIASVSGVTLVSSASYGGYTYVPDSVASGLAGAQYTLASQSSPIVMGPLFCYSSGLSPLMMFRMYAFQDTSSLAWWGAVTSHGNGGTYSYFYGSLSADPFNADATGSNQSGVVTAALPGDPWIAAGTTFTPVGSGGTWTSTIAPVNYPSAPSSLTVSGGPVTSGGTQCFPRAVALATSYPWNGVLTYGTNGCWGEFGGGSLNPSSWIGYEIDEVYLFNQGSGNSAYTIVGQGAVGYLLLTGQGVVPDGIQTWYCSDVSGGGVGTYVRVFGSMSPTSLTVT